MKVRDPMRKVVASHPENLHRAMSDGPGRVQTGRSTPMQQMKQIDMKLRDTVIRQLEWDPQVTSKDIGVAAADNTITLTGFVHNYVEKYEAEKAASAAVRLGLRSFGTAPTEARTAPGLSPRRPEDRAARDRRNRAATHSPASGRDTCSLCERWRRTSRSGRRIH